MNLANETKALDSEFKVIVNLGVLFRGYRKEYYYWEIVLFSRKFLLIFIGVFTEFFPDEEKATFFLLIITIYLFVHISCAPFKFEYMNRLETISLIISFLTGTIGILMFSDNFKPLSIFFVFIVSVLNFGFIIFWIHQFIFLKSFTQSLI